MNDALPNEVLHALDDLQQSIEAINQSIGRVGQLGRLAKAIQRIAIINEVKGLRQDLEAALQAFQLAMTIHTSKRLHEAALRAAKSSTQVLGELEVSANELSASRSSINSEAPWRALPAAPDVLFGRDTELNSVVHLLCKDSADGATCVVLGTGGVGKTSLVLAVLHNERVAALYPSRRLFVSCEGAADSSGVIGALAAGLGLAGEMLRVRVLHALSVAPCLVVLDNLESPWEPQTSRTSVEALVAAIDCYS
ncbi:hypothetical protein BKA62DRAFT_772484 [Auriculariales sp. MPI-PUGE-AT-0066]|nr:hypothetical protein BKA62DRAFT_772484 [Auriculariales sp. MPI-PUGE-AT-0066]